jgi:hypothetical protein
VSLFFCTLSLLEHIWVWASPRSYTKVLQQVKLTVFPNKYEAIDEEEGRFDVKIFEFF